MPQKCTICSHSKRDEIDRLLVEGVSLRDAAGRYDLTKSSLDRHKNRCLAATMAKAEMAVEQGEIVNGVNLIDQMRDLNRETLAILAEAKSLKDYQIALKAIARAERQIELQARLLGELQEGTTVNILVTPEWQAIRGRLLAALAPFPEAKLAIVEAIGHAE
jgi:hypothetical protein